MRHPLALAALAIQRAYERGGGGVIAGGLAFFAFFSVVPSLLLFTSVLGLLIEDLDVRRGLVDTLVEQLDPLREVARAVVDGLADSARTGTLVGLLGLLWGASGFYGALQGAMQRVFPGPSTRDFARTRIMGVLTVGIILASMISAVAATIVMPLVTTWFAIDLGPVSLLLAPVLACGVATLVALLVYVAVPPDGPSLRQAVLPAVIAGVAIGLLTWLFGALAPYLVRSFLALGVVGSVFIALAWLNLVFQILVYGAAFARVRRDRERAAAGPPTL
jgi:membrane protein